MGIRGLLNLIKDYRSRRTETEDITRVHVGNSVFTSNIVYLDYTSQLIKFYYNHIETVSNVDELINKIVTEMITYFRKLLTYNNYIYVFVDYKFDVDMNESKIYFNDFIIPIGETTNDHVYKNYFMQTDNVNSIVKQSIDSKVLLPDDAQHTKPMSPNQMDESHVKEFESEYIMFTPMINKCYLFSISADMNGEQGMPTHSEHTDGDRTADPHANTHVDQPTHIQLIDRLLTEDKQIILSRILPKIRCKYEVESVYNVVDDEHDFINILDELEFAKTLGEKYKPYLDILASCVNHGRYRYLMLRGGKRNTMNDRIKKIKRYNGNIVKSFPFPLVMHKVPDIVRCFNKFAPEMSKKVSFFGCSNESDFAISKHIHTYNKHSYPTIYTNDTDMVVLLADVDCVINLTCDNYYRSKAESCVASRYKTESYTYKGKSDPYTGKSKPESYASYSKPEASHISVVRFNGSNVSLSNRFNNKITLGQRAYQPPHNSFTNQFKNSMIQLNPKTFWRSITMNDSINIDVIKMIAVLMGTDYNRNYDSPVLHIRNITDALDIFNVNDFDKLDFDAMKFNIYEKMLEFYQNGSTKFAQPTFDKIVNYFSQTSIAINIYLNDDIEKFIAISGQEPTDDKKFITRWRSFHPDDSLVGGDSE